MKKIILLFLSLLLVILLSNSNLIYASASNFKDLKGNNCVKTIKKLDVIVVCKNAKGKVMTDLVLSASSYSVDENQFTVNPTMDLNSIVIKEILIGDTSLYSIYLPIINGIGVIKYRDFNKNTYCAGYSEGKGNRTSAEITCAVVANVTNIDSKMSAKSVSTIDIVDNKYKVNFVYSKSNVKDIKKTINGKF